VFFGASLANVSLTSVDQDGGTMGRTAGRLLLERIQGRTASVRFSVNPSLVPAGRPARRLSRTCPVRPHPLGAAAGPAGTERGLIRLREPLIFA
jgi:hypothetical protein